MSSRDREAAREREKEREAEQLINSFCLPSGNDLCENSIIIVIIIV